MVDDCAFAAPRHPLRRCRDVDRRAGRSGHVLTDLTACGQASPGRAQGREPGGCELPRQGSAGDLRSRTSRCRADDRGGESHRLPRVPETSGRGPDAGHGAAATIRHAATGNERMAPEARDAGGGPRPEAVRNVPPPRAGRGDQSHPAPERGTVPQLALLETSRSRLERSEHGLERAADGSSAPCKVGPESSWAPGGGRARARGAAAGAPGAGRAASVRYRPGSQPDPVSRSRALLHGVRGLRPLRRGRSESRTAGPRPRPRG